MRLVHCDFELIYWTLAHICQHLHRNIPPKVVVSPPVRYASLKAGDDGHRKTKQPQPNQPLLCPFVVLLLHHQNVHFAFSTDTYLSSPPVSPLLFSFSSFARVFVLLLLHCRLLLLLLLFLLSLSLISTVGIAFTVAVKESRRHVVAAKRGEQGVELALQARKVRLEGRGVLFAPAEGLFTTRLSVWSRAHGKYAMLEVEGLLCFFLLSSQGEAEGRRVLIHFLWELGAKTKNDVMNDAKYHATNFAKHGRSGRRLPTTPTHLRLSRCRKQHIPPSTSRGDTCPRRNDVCARDDDCSQAGGQCDEHVYAHAQTHLASPDRCSTSSCLSGHRRAQ